MFGDLKQIPDVEKLMIAMQQSRQVEDRTGDRRTRPDRFDILPGGCHFTGAWQNAWSYSRISHVASLDESFSFS